ncbi:MAG: hypothetical protein ABI468_02785 [Candidatus Nanopelagicales bacterium]
MPSHRRLVAVVAVQLAAALTLGGCAVGVEALTSHQPPSGNGASVTNGDLAARGLLLVAGTKPGTATLVGTVVNAGTSDDAITGVSVAGSTPTVTLIDAGKSATTIALPARFSRQFGYDPATHIDLTGFTTLPGSFATVTITYATAGSATVDVLTVLPIGNYAGLAPLPAVSGALTAG